MTSTPPSKLSGKRILVTRPKQQAAGLCNALIAEGAIPIEFPLITILPPASWDAFDEAVARIHEYEWIIFASANAVHTTIARTEELNGRLKESLKKIQIGCIGSATKATLESYGLTCAYVPRKYVAESFVADFPQAKSKSNANKILWPKTDKGRLTIKQELETIGWHVDIVNSYLTGGPENPQTAPAELLSLLNTQNLEVIVLTSSEAVRNMHNLLIQIESGIKIGATQNEHETFKQKCQRIKLAVIGPETAKTCHDLFGRVDISADQHDQTGLIQALHNGIG